MNTAFKISTLRDKQTQDMGIDWEFQPSLQHRVVRTESAHQDAPTWAETMPAPFDSFNEPVTVREAT